MSTFASNPGTMIKITFSGATEAGPISVTGLEVGDLILQVLDTGDVGNAYSYDVVYEPVISVADEIQQLNPSDFSAFLFTVWLLRGVV